MEHLVLFCSAIWSKSREWDVWFWAQHGNSTKISHQLFFLSRSISKEEKDKENAKKSYPGRPTHARPHTATPKHPISDLEKSKVRIFHYSPLWFNSPYSFPILKSTLLLICVHPVLIASDHVITYCFHHMIVPTPKLPFHCTFYSRPCYEIVIFFLTFSP